MVPAFKVQYILMEAFALLLRVRSHVLEFIKMSIKDMDLAGHPATHYAIVPCQRLHQLKVVFGHVIAQETTNHCAQAIPIRYLTTTEHLEKFVALQDLAYLWSNENTCFYLCFRQLGEASIAPVPHYDELSIPTPLDKRQPSSEDSSKSDSEDH